MAVAALAAFPFALGAQDPPPKEPANQEAQKTPKIESPRIAEYERAFVTQTAAGSEWNHHASTFWSKKQCASCHADPHAGTGPVAELFFANGTVANALGVEVAPVEASLRSHLNIDEKAGLVLSSVPEGSEGAKAGLKPFDVVLQVGDQTVSEAAKFNELVGGLQGKKGKFSLLRQGKPLALEITVPQLPQAMAILDIDTKWDLASSRIAWSDNRYRIGVTLSEADEALRSHLKLGAGEGLVVTEVVDDSPAAKMGVKQNDVLVELDSKRLTTVDAINAQIQEIKDKTVLLKLLRSGQEVTCQIAPKKGSEPAATWKELVLVDDARNHHPSIVRWLNANVTAVPPPNAAEELVQLKTQLAEMAKTVEKLETVIAPPAPPAEEKKPELEEKK